VFQEYFAKNLGGKRPLENAPVYAVLFACSPGLGVAVSTAAGACRVDIAQFCFRQFSLLVGAFAVPMFQLGTTGGLERSMF